MSLSDMIWNTTMHGDNIAVYDVKEFIKKRIDDLHDINNWSLSPAKALARLKLDAGEALS